MEVLFIILGICMSTLGYFCYKFMEFRKEEAVRMQKLNFKIQTLLDGVYKAPKEENVFREMAIDEISKQKLVYIPETGMYERRKQIS